MTQHSSLALGGKKAVDEARTDVRKRASSGALF